MTDSTMDWLQTDKHEWTNTKLIFDMAANDANTVIHFTPEGLVPDKECYALCSQGWATVILERLLAFTGSVQTSLPESAVRR